MISSYYTVKRLDGKIELTHIVRLVIRLRCEYLGALPSYCQSHVTPRHLPCAIVLQRFDLIFYIRFSFQLGHHCPPHIVECDETIPFVPLDHSLNLSSSDIVIEVQACTSLLACSPQSFKALRNATEVILPSKKSRVTWFNFSCRAMCASSSAALKKISTWHYRSTSSLTWYHF